MSQKSFSYITEQGLMWQDFGFKIFTEIHCTRFLNAMTIMAAKEG